VQVHGHEVDEPLAGAGGGRLGRGVELDRQDDEAAGGQADLAQRGRGVALAVEQRGERAAAKAALEVVGGPLPHQVDRGHLRGADQRPVGVGRELRVAARQPDRADHRPAGADGDGAPRLGVLELDPDDVLTCQQPVEDPELAQLADPALRHAALEDRGHAALVDRLAAREREHARLDVLDRHRPVGERGGGVGQREQIAERGASDAAGVAAAVGGHRGADELVEIPPRRRRRDGEQRHAGLLGRGEQLGGPDVGRPRRHGGGPGRPGGVHEAVQRAGVGGHADGQHDVPVDASQVGPVERVVEGDVGDLDIHPARRGGDVDQRRAEVGAELRQRRGRAACPVREHEPHDCSGTTRAPVRRISPARAALGRLRVAIRPRVGPGAAPMPP
jgi:hypothetical protein